VQLRRRLGKHNLFIRLLVPYLLFIVLAMLLGWLIYSKTLQLFEDEVNRNNMHLLEQVKVTLDRRLAEVDMIVQQLKNEPKIVRLQQVKHPFEGPTTYQVWDTQKSLYNFSVSNNFILDYYIYYNKSDLVISPASTYEMTKFYEAILYDPASNLKEWRSRFFEGYQSRTFMPAQKVIYRDKLYDMLIYRQSLGYPGDAQGSIQVLIDNREVLKLFGGIANGDGSSVYIMDEQGQVISSIAADDSGVPINHAELIKAGPSGLIEASARTGGMTITYTTSKQNGWSYVVAQPPHIVLEKVLYIKKIVFTVAAIFIAVGILLAYFFTYRNSKPLKAIVRTLSERIQSDESRTSDTFGFIQRTVSGLIDNNTELQAEIRRQSPLLRATFFERLLKGEVVGEKNIEAALLHQNLRLNDRFYAVALLRFTGYDYSLSEEMLEDLDYKRVIVKEALRRLLGDNNAHFHDLAEDKLALLFFDDSNHIEDCKRMIEHTLRALAEEMTDGLNIAFAIGVGKIYESRMELSHSYEEARQALSFYGREQANQIIWFETLPQEHDGYYYPVEVAARLMNVVKSGDWSEVEKLLVDLYKQNFIDRHLPLPKLQLFIYDLVANLIKLQEQILPGASDDIRPLLGQVHASSDMKSIYDYISKQYQAICEKVNERKRSQNLRLQDDILKLLDDAYMQADLNLDAAADQLNISKVYLSQFFKEQTGVNFSDYLENKRMMEARKLLVSTELTVNEIAEQVGYNSSNTFCRAFKRSNGLSPMVYRKSENPNQ